MPEDIWIRRTTEAFRAIEARHPGCEPERAPDHSDWLTFGDVEPFTAAALVLMARWRERDMRRIDRDFQTAFNQ